MTYDDPLFMAAKWGALLGAEYVDTVEDESGVDAQAWAYDQLRSGPEEGQMIHARMMEDPDVEAAFMETFVEASSS